ncbi:hypothetical protein [Spirillospora sp. NPDC029432]|uniref:hypothetical protein n=1 Tax=Spirillospora sp. NPDC029432 TaxID=3154599 RepID=UPI003454C2F9
MLPLLVLREQGGLAAVRRGLQALLGGLPVRVVARAGRLRLAVLAAALLLRLPPMVRRRGSAPLVLLGLALLLVLRRRRLVMAAPVLLLRLLGLAPLVR